MTINSAMTGAVIAAMTGGMIAGMTGGIAAMKGGTIEGMTGGTSGEWPVSGMAAARSGGLTLLMSGRSLLLEPAQLAKRYAASRNPTSYLVSPCLHQASIAECVMVHGFTVIVKVTG